MDIQPAVDALNAAFAADPLAMRALLINVVPCNQALADHPTIQVAEYDEGFTVGMLGVINGVLESLGMDRIASKWSDGPTKPDGSHTLLGFMSYQAAIKPDKSKE